MENGRGKEMMEGSGWEGREGRREGSGWMGGQLSGHFQGNNFFKPKHYYKNNNFKGD